MTPGYPVVPGVCFKDLLDFPGYAATTDGHIWSRRGAIRGGQIGGSWRVLKPQIRRGYYRVGLWLNGKLHWRSVHRLILETFVGPCPPGMEACHHPDPNRLNCRLNNLRWDTNRANINDAMSLGRFVRGSSTWCAKLDEADIPKIRAMFSAGLSMREIGRRYHISHVSISDLIRGNTWKHV